MGGDGKLVRGVSVNANTVHTAWYNDPETIKKTWPMEFESGVKLNRISQWGDKTDWATIEKKKGVYTIDPEMDKAITESVKKGVDILWTLDYGNNLYQQNPERGDPGSTWQKSHPFLQCAPTTPEALEGWGKFCGKIATHFKGRVKYFEIWNEENGWFFDSWSTNNTPEMVRAYGRALLVAAKAVKQANPDAKVVFGGTAGVSLDFVKIALEEGAGPYIDVVAFHPYGHPTPEGVPSHYLMYEGLKTSEWKPRPDYIKTYEQQIGEMRKLFAKWTPEVEVWADEMNWMAPGEPSDQAGFGDQSELNQAKH
ncbi:MAG: hypothetical protein WCL39_08420 [Armatimonadota bacterium]